MKCSVCGKPLSDPVSVKIGIGPICRIKLKNNEPKKKQGDLFSDKAQYYYEIVGDVIVIYDESQGGRTVTNDIERVLAEIAKDLKANGKLLKDFKVIYKDTQKVFDGVALTKDGRFDHFYSINEYLLKDALKKLEYIRNEKYKL
jgi:hypothetical protein